MVSVILKAVAGYLAVVAGCVGTYAAINGGLYNFESEESKEQVVDVLNKEEESEQLVQESQSLKVSKPSEPKQTEITVQDKNTTESEKENQLLTKSATESKLSGLSESVAVNNEENANTKNVQQQGVNIPKTTWEFRDLTSRGQGAIDKVVNFIGSYFSSS